MPERSQISKFPFFQDLKISVLDGFFKYNKKYTSTEERLVVAGSVVIEREAKFHRIHSFMRCPTR